MKVRQTRPLNVIQLLALDSIALNANGGARAASLGPPQAPASSPVFHDGTVGLSEQLFGTLKQNRRLKASLRPLDASFEALRFGGTQMSSKYVAIFTALIALGLSAALAQHPQAVTSPSPLQTRDLGTKCSPAPSACIRAG